MDDLQRSKALCGNTCYATVKGLYTPTIKTFQEIFGHPFLKLLQNVSDFFVLPSHPSTIIFREFSLLLHICKS